MTPRSSLSTLPKSLDEIMAFQHDRVMERFMKDFGSSKEEAEECFKALKQFFVVCATKPGYKVVSEEVDKMWHTFLLFTKDYREFCYANLGRFIEHAPFETPRPNAYIETREFAAKLFDLNPQLWNTNAKADCSSGSGE